MTAPFDLIVVGGGPGGSSAAAAALARGLSVAQIDRDTFPRVKPCAGGLTLKSYRALPFDVASMLRGEHRTVELNVWRRRRNRFTRRRAPLLRMVARPDLDAWMVAENRKQPGFRFLDGERVTGISYDGVFAVETQHRRLHARQLVGADGASSIVNKVFRVTTPKGFAAAVEVVLRRDEATLAAATAACIDFGAVDGGYGWVFPKDDHWNVGLYTMAKHRDLKRSLVHYIAEKGFRVSGDPLATFEGHRFPYGGYEISIPEAPVYIVGDAGGFGDPVLGEGIYHAVESGRIAGETAADALAGTTTAAAYYERIKRSVLLDTFVTYHWAKWFYVDPDRAMTILENPIAWRSFFQGYGDGLTFSRSLVRLAWLLPKSLVIGGVRHERDGVSQPFSLEGPLRGVPYLLKPVIDRARRALGLSP